MNNRGVEIAGFLAQKGWEGAEQIPFDADFSPRRYARLLRDDNRRAVLMDADRDQKTDEFVLLDELLRKLQISAPEIYAASPAQGLVLMEDLGGKNIGNLIDAGGDKEAIYMRAVDVLIHIHKTCDVKDVKALDMPIFGAALFASQVELFLDAYIPYTREREATHDEAESFRDAWRRALKGIDNLPQSLMLRDFMPDNLMDLPERKDFRSLGVLDFQDGGIGPVAYDLASLCEEVRRDGGGKMLPDVIAYYHKKAGTVLLLEELTNACAVLSAQRHMRILGIVASHAQRTGRQDKLAYVPRVKNYLRKLLQNEALKPVRDWVEKEGL
ncbi:MAG TPA: phosphotransferase [Alphaproteobacteria bacterium]|nr:phosphotransferase [Alphaproteobacteria bacterium]